MPDPFVISLLYYFYRFRRQIWYQRCGKASTWWCFSGRLPDMETVCCRWCLENDWWKPSVEKRVWSEWYELMLNHELHDQGVSKQDNEPENFLYASFLYITIFNCWSHMHNFIRTCLKVQMLTLPYFDVLQAYRTDQWLSLCCSEMNPDRVSLCVKHPYAQATQRTIPTVSVFWGITCCCFFNSLNSVLQTVNFRKFDLLKALLSKGHIYFVLLLFCCP